MDSLRATVLFSDDTLTVTVVESLLLRTDRSNRGRFLFASLRPVAVVVKARGRTYALDMNAQPVDIDRLDLPPDFEVA